MLTMKSKSTYTGNFANNLPSGQGILKVPGEYYYEGTFTPNGDKFKIDGKMVFDDGRPTVEGSWGDVGHE